MPGWPAVPIQVRSEAHQCIPRAIFQILSDMTLPGALKSKILFYMSDKYCDFYIRVYEWSGQSFCQFTSIYVRGCGGPFVSQTSVDTSSGITYYSNKRLVYFYKDGKECGNLISKSKDIEKNDEVILFPNPFYDEIQFENLSVGAQIHMYNVNGQLEVSAIYNGNPLNTILVPPGTYIILLRDGKQVITSIRTNKAW
ncbi:MAG: T9SS type A sorting domain-containing protein [Saprospiraceae bacterium]|nr:T9SS type A sorting domain-containing protein [Saprospiraceae bacterium]